MRYLKIQVKPTAEGHFTIDHPQTDVSIKAYPKAVQYTLSKSPLSGVIGYLDSDSEPETGVVEDWGQTTTLQLNVDQRSIGMDLGGERLLRTIEVAANDEAHGLSPGNFTLYISDDNVSYRVLTGWNYTDITKSGQTTYQFVLPNLEKGRYLKLHIHSIVENGAPPVWITQEDVKIYSEAFSSIIEGVVAGYTTEDHTIAASPIGSWGYSGAVNLADRSIGIDLGTKRQVGVLELYGQPGQEFDPAHIRIYQSDDNEHYHLVEDWIYRNYKKNEQPVHRVTFSEFQGKFLKIMKISGEEIIITNLQQAIQVFTAPVVNELTAQFQDSGTGLVADLGKYRQVGKVELYLPKALQHPDEYELLTSEDGSRYEPITHSDVFAYETVSQHVYSVEFDGVSTRYLKISGSGMPTDLHGEGSRVKFFAVTGVSQPVFNQEIPAQIGFIKHDEVPGTGSLSGFGEEGDFAFDTNLNSIGADLGRVQPVNRIRLLGNQQEFRLTRSDLSLYVSDDNVSYRKVDDWDLKQADHQLELYNFEENARYVKVHQHFSLESPTYTALGGTLPEMMKVAHVPNQAWTFSGQGEWQYKKQLSVQNAAEDTIYDRVVFVPFAEIDLSAMGASGKVGSSYQDLRFADLSGRELHYYIADKGIYIRIPELAGFAESTIEMYYGNPLAEPVSDGLNTFQVEYGNRTVTPWGGQHQSKVIQMHNGQLIEVFDRNANIYAHRSDDYGKTWDEPVLVADLGKREMMGSAVQLANGNLIVLFFQYNNFTTTGCLQDCDAGLYMTRSSDLGQSWSEPKQLDTGWNYNVTYTNPIELANGDIVAPFHYAYTDDGAFRLSVMYSADQGLTWNKSESDLVVPGTGMEAGATEGAVIELLDGSLKMYYRAQTPDAYQFGMSTSTDYGRTWAPHQPSEIYAANTMPAIKRDGERIYLVWGGNNAFGGTSSMRTPFNLAYSDDETQSWFAYRDLLTRTVYQDPTGRMVTQPDFELTDDDSMIAVWAHDAWGGAETSGWSRLVVEDFQRWLTRSHGGYSGFEAADLANNHWWVFSSNVRVSEEQRFAGTGSLVFEDEATSGLTEAMRSFVTGMSQGKIQFQLYPENLDSGFVVSLKASYSRGLNAPGTSFQLYAAPDGTLQYGNGDNSDWHSLSLPALTMNAWNEISLDFDNNAGQIEVKLNGVSSGLIAFESKDKVMNYVHLSSESDETAGTRVYMDELILLDASVELPSLIEVGVEQALNESIDSITIAGVQQQLEQYIADGEVEMPLSKQLTNSLQQATHHDAAGRSDQVAHHLERFLFHLHHPSQQVHTTETAAQHLDELVTALLQRM